MSGDVLAILIGYLLGSIPFSYLVTRAVTGKDIRYEGEGNVGARNAMHVAGLLPGLLAMLLDMCKGLAAYWVGLRFGSGTLALYATGVALMIGHGFPVWLRWRGGKGLGPAGGFFFGLWPYSLIGALAVLLGVRPLISNFNLCVAVTSLSFAVFTFWEGNNLQGLLFIALLLGTTGLKKAIDLPHERSIRSQSGWIEGLNGAHGEPDQNSNR